MKKLMTMIATVATAFGLFADSGSIFNSSFETAGKIPLEDGWTCADESATFTQKAYNDDAYVYVTDTNPRYADFGDPANNLNYLELKTTFGKPVAQTLDGVTFGNDGLFFDQLVKLTVCDEDPDVATLYNDAKIVVYVKDVNADAEGDVQPENHLFVAAGQYANGLKTAIYDCGTIEDVDDWKRITLKAIKVYDGATKVGFQLFVNTRAQAYDSINGVSGASAYDATAAANLTGSAQALNNAKKLFPAIIEATTLAGVAYDGQGSIDDVMVTTDVPFPNAAMKSFELSWDEHVTGLTYKIGGTTTPLDAAQLAAGSISLEYVPGTTMPVTVTPTYGDDGWAFDKLEGTSEEGADANTRNITAENQTIIVVSKDTTPRVTVTIDGVPTDYPSIGDAFAAISAQSAAAEVVLNEDLTLKTIEAGEYDITEGTLTGSAAVVLDLNGKIITGPATCDGGYTIDATTTGGLTITDKSEDKNGQILASNLGAVSCYGCDLAVDAGIMQGKVSVENATSEVTGGSFDYATNTENDEFTLTVPDGFEAKKDVEDTPAYWVVSEKAKATVRLTFDSTKVSVTGATDGQQFYVGDTITIVATPETGYESAVVTITGAGASANPYTVVDGDVEGGIDITVGVTATEWTITYMDAAKEFATDTYTIENRTTKDLNAGEKPGYTFEGWTEHESGEDVTSLAEMTGNLVLDGMWTAKTGTITFEANGGEGTQAAIDYTWGDTVTAPPCTFTAPKDGTFNCWSNATDGVTYAVGDELDTECESYTLVADWTIEQGGVPVDPSDEPTTDAGRANLKALNEALGDGAAAWAADVYGAGNTVPGSKLDASTPELIKAAAEYNLKVMASPVTVAVETAEDGGFTFTLTDAGDANPVVLKTKAQELIKYSASLEDGGDFAPSTDETVTAEVSNDLKVSAKFTGKDDSGEAANAGFMKVDLSVAE